MRVSEVKKRFRKDFAKEFNFIDGEEIYQKITKDVRFQLPNKFNYKFNKRRKVNLPRLVSALLFVFILILAHHAIKDTREEGVDELFKEAKVEYHEEPILVSSSYKGEELRIYKGTSKETEEQVQYFYYFSYGNTPSNVEYIAFVNLDTRENIVIRGDRKFGNISELINVSPEDNIKVIICYKDNQILSQIFVALQ